MISTAKLPFLWKQLLLPERKATKCEPLFIGLGTRGVIVTSV